MLSRQIKGHLKIIIYGSILMCFSGCDSYEEDEPVVGPRRSGKTHSRPYKIKGTWYYPQQHYRLEEEGIASYYGINDDEHQGPDAMGGIYDMHKMTAAHKTLPLPAVVEIHNLNNGKSTKVAVTDRGPFVDGRIIDVSVQTAKVLGFFGKGLTKVRVKALEEESKMLTHLSKNTCLKSCNLSDLLPKVQYLCQNEKKENSALSASYAGLQVPKAPSVPLLSKKLYVSIAHLSFDQAMWVRVQSMAFKWGHPRLQKMKTLKENTFMTLIGPFVQDVKAQQVMNFFTKYRMPAVVVRLS